MQENTKSLNIRFYNSTRNGGYKYRVHNNTSSSSGDAHRSVRVEDVEVAFDNYTLDKVEIYKHSYRPDSKDKFLVRPTDGLTSREPISDLVSISGDSETISASGYVEFVLYVKPVGDEDSVHEVIGDDPINMILEVDGVGVDSASIPRKI